MTDPLLSPDESLRAEARALIAGARFAALGTLDPATGAPLVTRVALCPGPEGQPRLFLSALSAHSRAIAADPRVCLLLAAQGGKGDPLAAARLSLQGRLLPDRDSAGPDGAEALRALWLAAHPKARVYIDLPDFRFYRLWPEAALLNAGFARAARLEAADLA